MLLAFDIGNTNIVVGCFDRDDMRFQIRLKTDPGKTVDEYSATIDSLVSRHIKNVADVKRAIISSVVPQLTTKMASIVGELFKVEPLVVGPGIKTGLPIEISDPSSVGADRVVNSVAMKNLYGAPGLVVDFGTATTIDYVGSTGAYEGGIIAPGIEVALASLVDNTAKLPRIEIAWPENVIGKSTTQAMQSGSVLGYLCLVDGLIERIFADVGPIEHIVATGGLGGLITEHSKYIKVFDPFLTLQGMRFIADLNS